MGLAPVCVCAKLLYHVRVFATLWTVARQATLSMGFSRQEHWRELACPRPWHLPHPGTLCLFCLLNWQAGSLPLAPLGGEGNGTPLQYFCLENPMDGEAW